MARKTDSLDRAAALPGSASKTRLRKLVCSDDCGYPPLRVSRAAIDAGLPMCVCGAKFWPWDLDDIERARAAGHLSDAECDAHPLIVEFTRQCNSVAKGQSGPGRAIGVDDSRFEHPSAIAHLRVQKMVRETAIANQLAAARARRVEDEIPF